MASCRSGGEVKGDVEEESAAYVALAPAVLPAGQVVPAEVRRPSAHPDATGNAADATGGMPVPPCTRRTPGVVTTEYSTSDA